MELCAIEIPNVLPRAAFQNKLLGKGNDVGITELHVPLLCSWLPTRRKKL